MTFEEAHTRKKYASPLSPISDYRILVVPEEQNELDSYMPFISQHFPKVEDYDALPFTSSGRFKLMAFAVEDGRVVNSECEMSVEF
jgi:hypothetical protein